MVGPLLEGAWLVEVPAGRVVSAPDRPRSGIILSGLARVYATRLDGSQVTLRKVRPGAAVRITVASPGRRTIVQAITGVEFLVFDHDRLISLGRRHVEVAMAIAEEVDRRLGDTELQLAGQGGSVVQRIAGALLDVSTESEPLEVAMSQETMAAMIGASRERVGHELAMLESLRLIARRRGRILLRDPRQLQLIAHNPANSIARTVRPRP
jgi:CRP/FNR family transcriptional regulator, cyclic AMP receptor protein